MAGTWFPYAVVAAVLYGLHQIFTKLAAERISDGLGALVVEGSAVATILAYLAALYVSGRWSQTATVAGAIYSVLTGVCVGAGTIAFFILFQRGGPLSAVPAILAGGDNGNRGYSLVCRACASASSAWNCDGACRPVSRAVSQAEALTGAPEKYHPSRSTLR